MSNYQITRIPKMRLRSLEAIKGKLDMRELSCSDVNFEHITSQERIMSLGESISRHLHTLNKDVNKLKGTNQQIHRTIGVISKAISTRRALSEERHILLQSLVTRTLSSKDIVTLNSSIEFLKTGNLIRLATMQAEADNLLQKLSKTVKTAHLKLAAAEKEVLAEKTIESLTSIGYQVKSKSIGNELLIRGKKQDLSIAAQITKNGELHIDMAGFEGGACKGELDRLNEELLKQGIGFEITDRVYHGKKEGGVLAQKIKKEITIEFNPLQSTIDKAGNKKGRNQRVMQLKRLHQNTHRKVMII
jgi:hypothetical protein